MQNLKCEREAETQHRPHLRYQGWEENYHYMYIKRRIVHSASTYFLHSSGLRDEVQYITHRSVYVESIMGKALSHPIVTVYMGSGGAP